MEKKTFNRVKNIMALLVLAFSSFVYLATIEPTASFWDCGEFITSSYKLEVGHAPGNPMFQLIARFFTLFTDNTHAAAAVNCCSAMCSSFTIFFLFLSIVHFGRRILEKQGRKLTAGNAIAVLGAGLAGALAFGFSDSFWFNAVEGEVYAMSSLATAVVLWAILKWEEQADEPYADRWLVLIAFLMGLSIGIHLLNLLVIPAMVFIYYYRKHENTKVSLWKGLEILCISGALVVLVLWIIIPGLPKVVAFTDRLFVNGLGAPFNVGASIFMAALFAAFFVALAILRKQGKAGWHTVVLSLLSVILGYSVFAVVVIRANANTPTNEYAPDNAYTLTRYISREQYGSKPVIYGESYKSIYDIKESTYWAKLDDRYVKVDAPLEAEYPVGAKMLFPRMWSSQSSSHQSFYDAYTKGDFRVKDVLMKDGEVHKTQMPKMKDNLAFFFDYQLNYMYFRYFFWNFVGRQNDLQGQVPGDKQCGNWLSGVKFLDEARLGNQEMAPDYIGNNSSTNHYFFLPLILGLIGFFFQVNRDGRNGWITFLLFFMTGIAIIIYINQTPYQARERDYSYAGSFYVFAIWIGLSVMALKEWFDKLVSKKKAGGEEGTVCEKAGIATASAASALALAVAVLMGCQNWDDHDRSGRRTVVEHAFNYLQSCDPNAILLTHGDNDTFPLWYVQEVEGLRTDVRIMNTSLCGMDWYIDQMKCRCNDSDPLPISLPREDYLYGTNDFVRVLDVYKRATAADVMGVFKNVKYRNGNAGIIAASEIVVPVNKENAIKYGIVPEKDADKMLDEIVLKIPKDATSLSKTDLVLLDIFSNYQWDRPIYFVSQNGDCTFEIGKYLQFEGYTYKVVPIECPGRGEPKQMDVDKMFDRVMNVYKFDTTSDTTVHCDYTNLYTFTTVTPIRSLFNQVALKLIDEHRDEDAEKVLDRCYEITPEAKYPYCLSVFRGSNEYEILNSVDLYLSIGKFDKAQAISRKFVQETIKSMEYSAQYHMGESLDDETLDRDMTYLSYLANTFSGHGYDDEYDWIDEAIKKLAD